METRHRSRIFTIPNILSMIRLLLIPVIVWLYCGQKDYVATAVVVALSGVTDALDGFIARTFHMTSDLGKILDPIADKLTQAVVLFCLVTRFPFMGVALGLFVLKEIMNAAAHMVAMKKTGNVYGANWHGKVMTCLLYAVMLLHILWASIPAQVSNISILLCIIMMAVSDTLYIEENLRRIRENEA